MQGSIAAALQRETVPLSVASMFESYEEDYVNYSRAVSRRISEVAGAGAREAKRTLIKQAEQDIEEADRCIQSMRFEARTLDPATKSRVLAKVEKYDTDLKSLKRDLQRTVTQVEHAELTGGGGSAGSPGAAGVSQDQRTRVMTATERLERSSGVLDQARRTVAETEQIGVTIMTDLHDQRQTLLRSKERVRETREYTSQARSVLKSMSRREVTNKIIIGVTIVVLLVLIGIVLYFAWLK